jgi:hypothetical protein|tara:strand:- start:187 stop:456 length:270 start_codon:yes stop_codon:yes gene_type:complete
MQELNGPNFKFYDECETIADYIQEHIYDTVHWQLPSPTSPYDPDHEEDMDMYNKIHAKAMAQVITILATRVYGLADEMNDYDEYKLNTK